jgi:hypothetical protein
VKYRPKYGRARAAAAFPNNKIEEHHFELGFLPNVRFRKLQASV